MSIPKLVIKDTRKSRVKYLMEEIPTNEFIIDGIARLSLWGGGTGEIEMDRTRFSSDNLTEEVIYDNLNDGGFGCERIISGKVSLRQVIDVKKIYADENGIYFEDNSCTFQKEVLLAENLKIKAKGKRK